MVKEHWLEFLSQFNSQCPHGISQLFETPFQSIQHSRRHACRQNINAHKKAPCLILSPGTFISPDPKFSISQALPEGSQCCPDSRSGQFPFCPLTKPQGHFRALASVALLLTAFSFLVLSKQTLSLDAELTDRVGFPIPAPWGRWRKIDV